jgi:hypothetical protein
MGQQSKAILTPATLAAQDIFLRRCVTELRLLREEINLSADAVALTGFALFCGGLLKAGRDPVLVFRELVEHKDDV